VASGIEAFIKAELLVWARESAGYSLPDAARKLGITTDKLDSWEKGVARPSIPQLQKAASLYKRPLAVFFLSEPPKTFDAMHDFRRLTPYAPLKKSPSLLFEIRKAFQRREVAIEISGLLDEPPRSLDLPADVADEPEKLSQGIRGYLGLAIEEQMKAKNRNEALNLWKESVERRGVLVFQTNSRSQISVREMRGFSISERPYPAIVLNSKDSPSGRIFTLIHEFIHVLLDNGGICDLEEYESHNSEDQRVEFFCNMTAGAVLVPQQSLLENPIVVHSGGRRRDWSDEQVEKLSDQYSVSREVVLRRLLIAGKATADFYRRKRSEFLQMEQGKGGGRVPFHRLILRDNGYSYTRLILDAYHQEAITASDLSDYLGTKLKHLYKIEEGIPKTQYRETA
jgi:Zn-dependent peptidase ImmA (M78 family)/DNA-binding XRE family transcriptional regulator